MKLIFNSRIARWLKVKGIVLWPFVFFAQTRQEAWVDRVYHHEMVHVEQIKRVGVFKFYVSYLMFYFALRLYGLNKDEAYRMIPWEVEAFEKEKNG